MKQKTLIFDLDGTLVDAKELHHASFEWAVQQQCPEFKLTDSFTHLFEGIPTLNKVEWLNANGYTLDMFKVYDDKQKHTDLHMHMLSWHPGLPKLLETLSHTYNLAIVSNARSHFVYSVMALMGITKFDIVITANFASLDKRKPAPYMFDKAINLIGANTDTTTIFEDSETGLRAAHASTAKTVISVSNSTDTYNHLEKLL